MSAALGLLRAEGVRVRIPDRGQRPRLQFRASHRAVVGKRRPYGRLTSLCVTPGWAWLSAFQDRCFTPRFGLMDLTKIDPRKNPAVPFLGLGRLAPFDRIHDPHGTHLRIYWNRCLLWGVALFPVFWVLGATGVYLFIKYQRQYPTVHYEHIVLIPFKLDEYRRAKGEFMMEVGKDLFKKREYLDAHSFMRAGLAQVPEARRLLGELYLAIRRPDLARPLLVEGLPYNVEQLDYLQWVFASLFRFQEDDAIVRIAADFLAAVPDASPNARHVVLMAQATAHVFRARYQEAEAVLSRYGTFQTQDGQLLYARIASERGQPEVALGVLRRLYTLYPDNSEAYAQLFASLLRLGRPNEARRIALLRQFDLPDAHRAYLDELRCLDEMRDEPDFSLAYAAYLKRFASSKQALDELATLAANLGRFSIAENLYENRATLPITPTTAAIACIEANLVAGRYGASIAAWQRVVQDDKTLPPGHAHGVDAMRAVALFAQGDYLAAQGTFTEFVSQTELRPELLILTARRLAGVGARELARQALKRALFFDPMNNAAYRELITLDTAALVADDFANTLGRLLALRQPPLDLLQALHRDLESDRYLFLPKRMAALEMLQAANL
jgi:Flp pilus assembly protein TadD